MTEAGTGTGTGTSRKRKRGSIILASKKPRRDSKKFKKGIPGKELKFFDTANSFLFDATGEVPATGQLVLIPQGDTESTRDGRLATIKSIQIRGVVTFAPGALGTAASVAYMALVLDKQANGAAAAITDVYTGADMSLNFRNLNNADRFEILKKWTFTTISEAGVTTAYNNVVIPVDYYTRCNIPIDWSSTAGAITEIRSNNLFLVAGSTVDDVPAFVGATRVRFVG